MTAKAPMATTRALTVSTPKALMMPMAAPKKTAGTKKVPAQYKNAPSQKRRKQILMLLPTHAERFNVDCMGDFFNLFLIELDGVGPVDKRPFTDYLHHLVQFLCVIFL